MKKRIERSPVVFILLYSLFIAIFFSATFFAEDAQAKTTSDSKIYSVEDAFSKQLMNVSVADHAMVIKQLKESVKQKEYLLKFANGDTLLLINPLDLSLKKGDSVDFSGNYRWNNKGGVVYARELKIIPSIPKATEQSDAMALAVKAPPGDSIKRVFQEKRDHVQVTDSGVIIKLLPDDTEGIRHQKFLVRVGDLTLLIAHNIDLAPRIPNLQLKESISFSGEYIWSAKGGVLHWTHHDPKRKRQGGFLKYKGKLYQ